MNERTQPTLAEQLEKMRSPWPCNCKGCETLTAAARKLREYEREKNISALEIPSALLAPAEPELLSTTEEKK